MTHTWTKPHYGVQHYGSSKAWTVEPWATVEDHGTVAILIQWNAQDAGGYWSNAINANFPTAEEARKAGEAYVNEGIISGAKA